jgi:hypothetical protein
MSDADIEQLFRSWWTTSYPVPPTVHTTMVCAGWGRFLLERQRQIDAIAAAEAQSHER